MNAPFKSLNHLSLNGLFALLCTLVLGSVSACSSDDIAAMDDATPTNLTPDTTEVKYMQLNLNIFTDASGRATRAVNNPYGGENGNGREEGTDAENKVSSVTVFIFHTEDAIDATTGTAPNAGINATATEAAQTTVYASYWGVQTSTESGVDYTTGVQEIKAPINYGETYHILVVANKDLSSLNGKTLADVRDAIYDTAPYALLSDVPTNAAYFVMSSTEDATFTAVNPLNSSTNNGTKNSPYIGSATIERLAARFDFDIENSENTTAHDGENEANQAGYYYIAINSNAKDGETNKNTPQIQAYKYAVTPKTETTTVDGTTTTKTIGKGDYFYLTNVVPFNVTNQSYLFKRVATSDAVSAATSVATLAKTYLGDELPSTIQSSAEYNVQTNYVIDPYFYMKEKETFPDDFYDANLRRTYLVTSAANDIVDLYSVSTTTTTTESDGDKDTYFTVGYGSENTFPASVQDNASLMREVATGLRFDGYYVFSADGDGKGAVIPVHSYYYLRHSDPEGNAKATAVMRNGIVRNNIYRVHIGRVDPLESSDFNIQLIIRMVPWQKYTHE